MKINIRTKTFILTISIIVIANILTLGVTTKFYQQYFANWQIEHTKEEVAELIKSSTSEANLNLDGWSSLLYSRYGTSVTISDKDGLPILTETTTFNAFDQGDSITYTHQGDSQKYEITIAIQRMRLDLIVSSFRGFQFYIFGALLIISMILSLLYAHFITKPIRTVHKGAKQFAELNFTNRIKINDNSEIGELSDSLNTMARSLEEALDKLKNELDERIKEDQLKTEFISNVSHELKTPLSVISCHVEVLEKSSDSVQQKESFQIIKGEIKKTNQMINSMLDLLRYEEATEKLDLRTFDLRGLIEDTLVLFGPQLENRHITVKLKGDYCQVNADPDKIEKVIVNLISNVVRYADENSIAIIQCQEELKTIRINVKNNCPIIENPQALIRRFYQGDHSRSSEGTGLGLSIVDAILKLHGSNLEIKNVDSGLMVSFDLPKSIELQKT